MYSNCELWPQMARVMKSVVFSSKVLENGEQNCDGLLKIPLFWSRPDMFECNISIAVNNSNREYIEKIIRFSFLSKIPQSYPTLITVPVTQRFQRA